MIVVTAPTGAIGHQVLRKVIDAGAPARVVVRDPSRLSADVRKRVDVVQGSHGDPDVVTKAFANADAVFWLVPPNLRADSIDSVYVDFTRPACDALKNQGVHRVVGVSALGRGLALASHAGLVTGSLAMDDMITSTGVSYRALTLPSFMDNVLRQVESIRSQGMLFSPIDGDLRLPTCATRDIAALAAKLLLDSSWTGQDHVSVLGPEDLSYNEMARTISDVLGKPVRFQQTTGEAYKARLIAFGASEAMAQAMLDMMMAKNAGLDNAEPRTPQSTSPTSFRQWCEEILKPAVQKAGAN